MLKTGNRSPYYPVHVSQSLVDDFKQALKLPSSAPLPPTLPIYWMFTLNYPWRDQIPHPLVHGRQSCHYEQDLEVGRDYWLQFELKKVRPMTRDGRHSLMIEQIMTGYDEEKQTVFQATSLLITYPDKGGND